MRAGGDGDDEPEWYADEFDLYDDDREFPSNDELGDDNVVPYTNPEDEEETEAETFKPPRYSADPRMRIMTEDEERWDKDGTDRMKFPWEKAWYEVPEIHHTPEMLQKVAEFAERRRLREAGPQKPWDLDEVQDSYAANFHGQDLGWGFVERLREYVPSPEDEERQARIEAIQQQLQNADDLEKEEKTELELELVALAEEQPRTVEGPDGTLHYNDQDVLRRYNAANKWNAANLPDYSILAPAYNGPRWVPYRGIAPLEPFEVNPEAKLSKWETRALAEKKKQKERRAAAFAKHFEEQVGAGKEYNCTRYNDVRLKPRDGSVPKDYTHEEIMAIITMDGENADPEQVAKDSLTVVDPTAPVDHVQDLGLTYIPTTEESIAMMDLWMPPENVERHREFDDLSLVDEDFQALDQLDQVAPAAEDDDSVDEELPPSGKDDFAW